MTESDNLADTINKATSPQGGAGVPEAPDGGPKPSAGQAVGGADQPAAPKRPRVPITNLELDPNKLAEEMKKSERSKTEREQVDDAELGRLSPTIRGVSRIISGLFRPR